MAGIKRRVFIATPYRGQDPDVVYERCKEVVELINKENQSILPICPVLDLHHDYMEGKVSDKYCEDYALNKLQHHTTEVLIILPEVDVTIDHDEIYPVPLIEKFQDTLEKSSGLQREFRIMDKEGFLISFNAWDVIRETRGIFKYNTTYLLKSILTTGRMDDPNFVTIPYHLFQYMVSILRSNSFMPPSIKQRIDSWSKVAPHRVEANFPYREDE